MSSNIPNNKYNRFFNEEVYKNVPKGAEVLDVGCWNGDLANKLINVKHCKVDGIEINKQAIKNAKKNGIKNIFEVDLNCRRNELKNIKKKYDCIILADIIEHLLDPEDFLISIRGLLKKDGILVISTPNIAFILYRVKLLFGIFDYVDAPGVMDKTHTRFFTISSLINILKSCKYDVRRCYGFSAVQNKYFFLRILSIIIPSLFGIQILLLGKNFQ